MLSLCLDHLAFTGGVGLAIDQPSSESMDQLQHGLRCKHGSKTPDWLAIRGNSSVMSVALVALFVITKNALGGHAIEYHFYIVTPGS